MSSLSNIIIESKIYSDPVLYFVVTYTVLIGFVFIIFIKVLKHLYLVKIKS